MKPSSVCMALCLLAVATAQPAPEAGARDMFFGGFDYVKPGSKPAAARPAPKPAARKAATPAPSAASTTASRPRPSIPVMNAALGPLGLRYSILKVNGIDTVEVPASTRFKSGDRIQLKVKTNSDGYLYIVTQGSSGAWNVIFPKAGQTNSNRVNAGDEKLTAFRFDSKPGVEKLFVVLTRVPEPDLERALSGSGEEAKPTPARPKRDSKEPVLMASNLTVSDPLVSHLRTSYTRDLVLEEVDAPATQERAVYVATRTTSSQARVVVDIKLIHE